MIRQTIDDLVISSKLIAEKMQKIYRGFDIFFHGNKSNNITDQPITLSPTESIRIRTRESLQQEIEDLRQENDRLKEEVSRLAANHEKDKELPDEIQAISSDTIESESVGNNGHQNNDNNPDNDNIKQMEEPTTTSQMDVDIYNRGYQDGTKAAMATNTPSILSKLFSSSNVVTADDYHREQQELHRSFYTSGIVDSTATYQQNREMVIYSKGYQEGYDAVMAKKPNRPFGFPNQDVVTSDDYYRESGRSR